MRFLVLLISLTISQDTSGSQQSSSNPSTNQNVSELPTCAEKCQGCKDATSNFLNSSNQENTSNASGSATNANAESGTGQAGAAGLGDTDTQPQKESATQTDGAAEEDQETSNTGSIIGRNTILLFVLSFLFI